MHLSTMTEGKERGRKGGREEEVRTMSSTRRMEKSPFFSYEIRQPCSQCCSPTFREKRREEGKEGGGEGGEKKKHIHVPLRA
jgi:hypothetical protein